MAKPATETGRARAAGNAAAVYAAPHLISKNSVLSGIDGVLNGVIVRGNASGDVLFSGAGAGKTPTASAVAADVIDAVKHINARKLLSWGEGGQDAAADPMLLESSWYIRTDASREKIRREFGEVIFADPASSAEDGASAVQEPAGGRVIAFKSAVMNGKMLREMLGRGINALSVFRVLGDY